MLLLWAGIIGLAAGGIVRLTRRSDSEDDALVTAKERHARGEISKEEFRRVEKDLC